MIGLLPTPAPPKVMVFLIWSSVTDFCHAWSANERGLGVSAAAPGPSPWPVMPWQVEHSERNSSVASLQARAPGPVLIAYLTQGSSPSSSAPPPQAASSNRQRGWRRVRNVDFMSAVLAA